MIDYREWSLLDNILILKRFIAKGATLIGTDTDPYQFRRSPSLGDYNRERDEIVGVSVGFNQLVDTTDTSVTVPSGHKYIAKINGTWSVGTSSGTALTVDGSNNDMVIDLTQMLGSTIADYIVTQGNTNGVAFFRKYFSADYYPFDSGSIRSVEGLVSHDMMGKNLLNPDPSEWHIGSTYRNINDVVLKGATARMTFVDRDTSVDISGVYVGFAYDDLNTSGATPQLYHWCIENGALASNTSNMSNNRGDQHELCQNVFIYPKDNETFNKLFARYYIQVEFGSTATDYEPYTKHSYPLDSTVTLRGLLKLEDGKLKADGDIYKADGTVTRKYGAVDLGTLNWSYDSDNGFCYAPFDLPRAYEGKGYQYVCAHNKFVYSGTDINWNSPTDGLWVCPQAISSASRIYAHDSVYTSASDFKTAMNGVMLVYELNEPTTDTAQPYAKNQKVSPSGTEEYVTTSVVPVGHNTEYYG